MTARPSGSTRPAAPAWLLRTIVAVALLVVVAGLVAAALLGHLF